MKRNSILNSIILAALLMLLLDVSAAPRSTPSGQNTAMLEVVHTVCQANCESETVKVYPDGRYVSEGRAVEKAPSGRSRNMLFRTEKQLEASELADLINWAEQPEFLDSQSEYEVTTVTDSPDWFNITYRNKGMEKNVKVLNFSRGTKAQRAKIPVSAINLLKWAIPSYFIWTLAK